MRARWTFLGGLLVVVAGSILLYASSILHSADIDLHFTRDVFSSLNTLDIGSSLADVREWPRWLYSTTGARLVDSAGKALPSSAQMIARGSFVELELHNKRRGPWGHFEVLVQVEDYVPNRLLDLRILGDSQKKLTRLFSRLEWKIELIPQASGTWIHGAATAHTANWRSRLFGRIAERALMNQVFYPNLQELARMKTAVSRDAKMTIPF